MLRRKRQKKQGFAFQTIALLGKNVGGNMDRTLQQELEDKAKEQQHNAQCTSRGRKQGREILHSKVTLLIVVILCMVDCVLVIGELILDMHAIKERGDAGGHGSTEGHGSSDGHNDGSYDYQFDYESGTASTATATKAHAEVHGHTIPEQIAHGFHYASIAILAILFVETLIKIVCFGTHFLKKKFEVFDAFVVFVSFVLDLVFIEGTTSRSIQESAYILSFILPWRVIRVVNSMIVALFDHEHIKLLLMFKSKQYLSKQIDDLSEDLKILQKQIGAVKKLSIAHGVPDWKIGQVMGKIYGENKTKKHALSTLVSMSVGMAVNNASGIWSIEKEKVNGSAVGAGKENARDKPGADTIQNRPNREDIPTGTETETDALVCHKHDGSKDKTDDNVSNVSEESDTKFSDAISRILQEDEETLLQSVPNAPPE